MNFVTKTWRGRSYTQCPRCKGWGRSDWAHSCKIGNLPFGNWHASPQELEEQSEKRMKEIEKFPPVMTADAAQAPVKKPRRKK